MGKIIYSVKSIYDNKEWGRTLKTSVVLAIVMLVGLTPFLSYANSLVVNKTTLNLKGERVSTEDYIRLEWDKPDQEEPYTYQVYSKKPNSGEYQSISSSNLDTQKIVKALNVFPVNYTNTQGSNYIPIKETGGKDLAGKPLYNSAMLEEWVGEYGHGRIEVDSINQNDFNDNPDKWLKDSEGNYQYDVVAVGFWNINAGQNSYLGDNGIDALRTFAESGRGLLTGHHHIGLRELDKGMNKLRDLFGIKLIGEDGWNQWSDTYVNNPVVMDYTAPEKSTTPHGSRYWATGDEVVATRRGLLLEYPNYVAEDGRVFDIPLTHNGGDYVTGDVWLEFTSGDSYLKGTTLVDPPMLPDGTKGTTNSYLSTYNNTAFIQAGHSSLTGGKLYSTEDEKKLIANTIFYLAQLTTDTNLTDRSAMDSYPPVFKGKEVNVIRGGGKITVDFPEATDTESVFEYYIEATGQNTGYKKQSETISVNNTSGLAGYSYISDTNPTTVPDNKVDTVESRLSIGDGVTQPKYVHIVAVDKNGNSSEPIHVTLDDTKPEVKTAISPEGWTNEDVVIKVNANDNESGVKSITLPSGEVVNGSTTEYKVTSNGEYTFKVTDKVGNVATHTETIRNIDKVVPKVYANVLNTAWTRGTVGIEVTSGDSLSGLAGIEMIRRPQEGDNLVENSNFDNSTIGWVHVNQGKNTYTGLGIEDWVEIQEDAELGNMAKVKGLTSTSGLYLSNIVGGTGALKLGDTYTLTAYMKADEDMTIGVAIDGSGLTNAKYEELTDEWKRISKTFKVQDSTNQKPRFYGEGDFYVTKVKLEKGEDPTPWTPASTDIDKIDTKKVYPVVSNGVYTFKSTYNSGTVSETSINVTNIDRGVPTISVTGNTTEWVEEDTLTLTVNAQDTQSGVKSITLPDGKVVNSAKATYTVNENKDYVFSTTDNVGNTTTHTETVDRMMVPYTFYIYDDKGKPVEGVGFDLLRDGTKYTDALSDKTGLVNFGKVPPIGKYTIKQTKAPDGYVIDPNEKGVEVGDTTEPEEYISYPRGRILPATGTDDILEYVSVIGTILTGLTIIKVRKLKLIK